jgi:serine phosphatase RsbU (regulator of sigma subunit)
VAGASPEPVSPPPRRARHRGGWPPGPPLLVFLVTIVATGGLAALSQSLYASNEQRLLHLRVREAASLVSSALPDLQTSLASAAELADATHGDVARFRRLAGTFTGTGRSFVSVSLWRRGGASPLTVVGLRPKLAGSMASAPAFFARAAATPKLSLIGLLSGPSRRIGYGYAVPGVPGGYIAYGETPLPKNRRSRYQKSSAFSDLDYAIYLGTTQNPGRLLVTDLAQLPITGRRAMQTIPFGDSQLTLAMTPRGSLSGSLPERLPLLVAVVGALLALGATAVTLRLSQRRRDAEGLADELEVAVGENRRLYAEQRGIAQTLQHALLPEALPQAPGIESAAQYEAGERGMEIGGDWYDLIAQDDRRWLLVVGDVSGRGLRAATTMASLRYAIRAYAAQHDPPATILTKLSSLVNVSQDGQLATVLCLLLDSERREIHLTSAGHLPPLLISGRRADYLDCEVGLPIGVDAAAAYVSRTISVPATGTLLAFTDGLVERRGESLDEGLARLRDAATGHDDALPELLGRLVAELHSQPSEDDTAIVGLRWTS